MNEIINGAEPPQPQIDAVRKQKVFEIAKHMKKSCYKLRAIWFDDVEKWGVVCSAMIDGVPYDSANFLDDFEPKDHADIFRAAFSHALQEAEKEKKGIITLH